MSEPVTFTINPAEFKPCGDCAMCCKLPAITDSVALNKPAGQWCHHWSKKGGCDVYEEREEVCRVFNCLWKVTTFLGEELKPSKTKCVLVIYKEGVLIVHVDPAFPDAWKRGAMGEYLMNWDKPFLVECGDTKIKVTPRSY